MTYSTSDPALHRPRSPLKPLQRALLIVTLAATLTVGGSVGDSASASTTTVETAASTPAPAPTPTSSPTQSGDPDHSTPNEEQGVKRDDLALMGVMFVIGLGFILAAGALGVLAVARERRRRDRAAAAASSPNADKETSDAP